MFIMSFLSSPLHKYYVESVKFNKFLFASLVIAPTNICSCLILIKIHYLLGAFSSRILFLTALVGLENLCISFLYAPPSHQK